MVTALNTEQSEFIEKVTQSVEGGRYVAVVADGERFSYGAKGSVSVLCEFLLPPAE